MYTQCSHCKETTHQTHKCPELYEPLRNTEFSRAGGGGGGGHSHDDDDETIVITIPILQETALVYMSQTTTRDRLPVPCIHLPRTSRPTN